MAFNISPKVRKEYLILLSVFILSLLIRIWLLDKRWINPDEGAHLMDAVLILDGKVPEVDFVSRQPIYAYVNAIVLKLLGVSYISGRLLPMTFSVLVGFIVFFMALMLFDQKVAILSAAIYWMLPLELINSVVVKTEPLVTVLTCLSLCAVILFSRGNRKAWLIFSGIFAAMGFYVRQSALIIPLTVFGFLLFHHRGRFRDTALCFGIFFIGYVGVIFFALIYYTRFMTFEKFSMSWLSPFGFLVSAGEKLVSIIGSSNNSANNVASHISLISYDKYKLFHKYILQAVKLHLFLLIGLGFSLITFSRRFFYQIKTKGKELATAYSLLYLWIFSLFIAYVYYYHVEAFYIDYFREFLPPLVIIFSAWLCSFIPSFERDEGFGYLIAGGLLLSAILFVAEWYFKKDLGGSLIVCISLALFTLFYFAGTFISPTRKLIFWCSIATLIIIITLLRQAPLTPYLSGIVPKFAIIGVIFCTPWVLLSKKTRPKLTEFVRFTSYFIALGAFVLSLTFSVHRLTLTYDSNWPPNALENVSAYLKSHTRSTDSVMSGAVIWELQALRKPFLSISHPLGFEYKISQKERERLEAAIKTKPPEVIILDGVTEKTYFRQIPWLWEVLNSMYNLVYTAEPAKNPVKIYQQKSKRP